MHQAFVLAAGFGTRLRPLTLHRPKPLVPICGVPLLSYALALCAKHGLTDVVVNAHWLAEQVEAWAGEREGCTIAVSVEAPEILGTGGGLRQVEGQLGPRVAVLNGDVLHNVDLTALIAAVPDGGGAMALRRHPEDAVRYGVVAGDAAGRVVQIRHFVQSEPEGAVDRTTHFTGIHALDPASLRVLPAAGESNVRDLYVALVPDRLVGAVSYEGIWLDAGDPAAYLDTNLAVLDGRIRFALDPFPRAGFSVDGAGVRRGDPSLVREVEVTGPVWIGAGAHIAAGARLDHAVVGPGATVPADAVLTGSVVWDDVAVPAGVHAGVVVHPGGVLQVT